MDATVTTPDVHLQLNNEHDDQTDDCKTSLYTVDIRYESDTMRLTTNRKSGSGASITAYGTDAWHETWSLPAQCLQVMAAGILQV